MRRLSSIFSSETLRRPCRLPRAALFALALLIAAELAARAAVRVGALRPGPSMYSLIDGNVRRVRTNVYDVWLMGNSTLAAGVEERTFGRLTNTRTIAMPHGSATPRALAALADYYLARAVRPPQAIVVFATEADFNLNGYRAHNSRGYFDYIAGRYWHPLDHVMLYAARESLVRRTLDLLPASLRGPQLPELNFDADTEDDADAGDDGTTRAGPTTAPVAAAEVVPRFTGRPIPGRNTFHNALIQRYRFDTGAFDELADVARRHGVPHIAVVVVPVTDIHRRFFDIKLPNLTTEMVRRIAADESAKRGITFLDTSTAVQSYADFADDYHMNRDGRAIYTVKIAELYNEHVVDAPPLPVQASTRDTGRAAHKAKARRTRDQATP